MLWTKSEDVVHRSQIFKTTNLWSLKSSYLIWYSDLIGIVWLPRHISIVIPIPKFSSPGEPGVSFSDICVGVSDLPKLWRVYITHSLNMVSVVSVVQTVSVVLLSVFLFTDIISVLKGKCTNLVIMIFFDDLSDDLFCHSLCLSFSSLRAKLYNLGDPKGVDRNYIVVSKKIKIT